MGAKAKQVAQNLKSAAEAAKKNPTLGDIAGMDIEKLKGSVKPTAEEAKKELDSLALPDSGDLDALLSELEQEDKRDAEIEAYKAEVATRTEKCVKLATVIGKLLADEEDSDFHKEKIGKAKSTIIEQLTGITRKSLQRQASVEVAKTFFEALPASDRGVEMICDYMVAVGLMKGVQAKAAGSLTVTFEGEDGKQYFRYLVPEGADVPSDVVKAFKAFVEAPSNALLEERKKIRIEQNKALREFRKGTAGNILEVLETEGETVIPAYDREVGVEGQLRVAVSGGLITPVGALGKYSEVGNQMIEKRIAIPTASVGKERLELKKREENRERFGLMLKLHRAVNFWFAVLREQKELIEKAKTTGKWVEPHAFVVEKKVGVTYLFVAKLLLFDRKPLRNVHLVLERRDDGAIKVVMTGSREDQKEAFAPCMQFKVPGGKYEGLAKVLQRALQFSYGKLVREEKIRKRKEAARLVREAQTGVIVGTETGTAENEDVLDESDDGETDETSDSEDASEEE